MSRKRRLGDLLAALDAPVRAGRAAEVVITGVTDRSEEVRPGVLFVAVPGTSADGHAFVADAARRGAAAIVVERDVGGALDAPLVRVTDARRSLAELAAAWHGRPADRLTLVGITGTAGKTSTLSLLETILVAAGRRVGSVGSLGVHIQGRDEDSSVYTTPDPMLLHGELGRLVDAGTEIVVMEATSHALVQDRVHGLRYAAGLFTNLLPLEHSDFHPDFDDYARAKSRFFDLLAPDAPLVYDFDDPGGRGLVEARWDRRVAVGCDPGSDVRVSIDATTHAGTRLALEAARPVPAIGGGSAGPFRLDVRIPLLGTTNVSNTALAVAAALSLGVDPERVPGALARFEPPRRRMEIIHRGRFTILDDTVGHPDSLSAVFQVASALEPVRLHVVYAVRGRRGERINRENATTLAIWSERLPLASLVVTRSTDVPDPLNRVEDAEYEAFLAPLRERGVDVLAEDRLDRAVVAALERADVGDLVALLGAQGMDPGRDIALRWLASKGPDA